jgi:hypothetical protein
MISIAAAPSVGAHQFGQIQAFDDIHHSASHGFAYRHLLH